MAVVVGIICEMREAVVHPPGKYRKDFKPRRENMAGMELPRRENLF